MNNNKVPPFAMRTTDMRKSIARGTLGTLRGAPSCRSLCLVSMVRVRDVRSPNLQTPPDPLSREYAEYIVGLA